MRILLIEDDHEMAGGLIELLSGQDWSVEHVDNAGDGLKRAAANAYDMLLVDRMLPDIENDGLEVIRKLRELGVMTPALVISALGEIDHRIDGLGQGADDYLPKPFSREELVARVMALRRRAEVTAHPEIIVIDDLEVHTKGRRALRAGEDLGLMPKEFALLLYLAQNEGNVVTKGMILQHAFGYSPDMKTDLVEVRISGLRKKLDPPEAKKLLHTSRGEGYVLNPGES